MSIYSSRLTINVSRKSSSPFCLSFYYPHSRLLLSCLLYPTMLFVLSRTMNKHLCLSSTRWHHFLGILSPNTQSSTWKEEERRIHTTTIYVSWENIHHWRIELGYIYIYVKGKSNACKNPLSAITFQSILSWQNVITEWKTHGSKFSTDFRLFLSIVIGK